MPEALISGDSNFPDEKDNWTASKLLELLREQTAPRIASGSSNLAVATQESAENFTVFSEIINRNDKISLQPKLSLGRDFAMVPGRAVFVYTDVPLSVTIAGRPYPQEEADGTVSGVDASLLLPGYNFFNPFSLNGQKTRDLLGNSLAAYRVSGIASFDNGSFQTVLIDGNGDVFGSSPEEIDRQRGYFFKLDEQ